MEFDIKKISSYVTRNAHQNYGKSLIWCTGFMIKYEHYLITKVYHIKTLSTLSVNFTKWSNTLKQFVGTLPMNCLSVFDHFVGLALKGLSTAYWKMHNIQWKVCTAIKSVQCMMKSVLNKIKTKHHIMHIVYHIIKST